MNTIFKFFRLCLIFLTFIPFSLTAETKGFITPQISWNRTAVAAQYSFSAVSGIENRRCMFSLAGNRDAKRYYVGLGALYSSSDFSAEAGAALYPLSLTSFKMGPYVLFNYRRMFDYMSVYNFMGGAVFKFFLRNNSLLIQFDTSFMYKRTVLDAIKQYVPYLTDKDFTVNLAIAKRWNGFSMYGSVASYEPYLYSFFIQPKFIFGMGYMVNKNLSINMEGTVAYSDMFTLTAYIDHVMIRTSLIYRFGV